MVYLKYMYLYKFLKTNFSLIYHVTLWSQLHNPFWSAISTLLHLSHFYGGEKINVPSLKSSGFLYYSNCKHN